MDIPPPAGRPLVDAVRILLAEDGRPPSRRRVVAWIALGAVTLDGRVVRDPTLRVTSAARLAVDLEAAFLEEVEGAPGARSPRAAQRAASPTGVLHADTHLVVCDRGAFAAEAAPDALAAEVSAVLSAARGRPVALHPVLDPSRAGSGPVPLGTSRAGAQRLAALLGEGGARETLLALRSPALAGPGEVVLQPGRTDAPFPCGLVKREDAPLGGPPAGARDLVPPHRALLTFKHPRTNRRLTFACDPSAAFAAACARLLVDPPR
jgi:hypothetical protein